MNKCIIGGGIIMALLLASCGDDEVKFTNAVTLYSRPDTIHLGGGDELDSILVKGFTACTAYDAKWGTLPETVSNEFDMKDSYLYFSYEVKVVLLEDTVYNIGMGGTSPKEKLGFTEGFDSHSYSLSTFSQANKLQVNLGTHLIYVEKTSGGEAIDRWLPMRPEELQFVCYRLHLESL